jgi:hypothetical protein
MQPTPCGCSRFGLITGYALITINTTFCAACEPGKYKDTTGPHFFSAPQICAPCRAVQNKRCVFHVSNVL